MEIEPHGPLVRFTRWIGRGRPRWPRIVFSLAFEIIYGERSDALSAGEHARWAQWESHRLTTEEDVPWTTISKAMIELGDIRRKAVPGATSQLQAIEEYLKQLALQHGDG